ncbi:MAG: hypothetical protein JNL83_09490 [Myxococcales bacterium]|nr:hypothetical protein [Myxococcales bacterium]
MHRPCIAITLGLALSACTADNGGEAIYLSKNVAPGMGCTFSASAAEQFTAHGTYSMFATRGYRMYPQLVSQLTAADGQTQARTIQVRGARVDLTFADSSLGGFPSELTKFQSLFSAPLPPNGGIADGAFELIPAELARMVAAAKGVTMTTTEHVKTELIAKVVVFGDLAGDEVVSQEFQFPVTLCNDCVTTSLGACPIDTAVTPIVNVTPNVCNPFQDGVVDCCVQNNELVCPAVAKPEPNP